MKKRQRIFRLHNLLFPILLGFYIFLMVAVSPITFEQGLAFFAYQVFSVWVSGMAIIKLLKIPECDSIERILCGYSMGYVWSIIQYFIFAIIDALQWLKPFQIVFCLFSLGYLVRGSEIMDVDKNGNEIKKEWAIVAILFTLVMGIRYVTYYGLNLLPSMEQPVTFPTQDILFYIGNAISAKKGFPLEEFRYAGEVFKYHYFGSIHLAVTSLITGIETLKLELCLQWISSSLIVISTFYCLLRRMNLVLNLRILGMVILLFTAGKELIVYVAYQHIMYKSPFGFDLGLAMGIFTIMFLYIQYQNSKMHFGLWGGTLLAFFACAGSKAPIAVIILSLAGCICGLWLFSSSTKKRAFIYGTSLLVSFLIIFFGIVSNGLDTITTNSTGLVFNPTGHLYECGLGKLYFEWTAQGMPEVLGKALILVLFFFDCNFVTYFLMLIFTGQLIKQGLRKSFSFEGSMLLTACVGLLFTLLTKQQGNSQMYFAMTSFPVATIASIKIWNDSNEMRALRKRIALNICVLVLLCLSFTNFIQILAPTFQEGLNKLEGTDTFSQESNSLTYEEQEAYTWIRENTEENAVCVVNLVKDENQYQSFIVGVCTERQMYIEGWRYVAGYISSDKIEQRRECIKNFFHGDEDAYREILEADVEYVIRVKRYEALETEWHSSLGTKIYENKAVEVYRIKN